MNYFCGEMKKPKLVVLDLAGTTVKDNCDVERVLQETLSAHNIQVDSIAVKEAMGYPKPVAIARLLMSVQAWRHSDKLVASIHEDFISGMISFYQNDPDVGEKEGATATFEALKRAGIKIAVDTGFDRRITDHLLHRMGWLREKLVDFSITSDEVVQGRPFPDMIFRAMNMAGVSDPSAVAKVGDTASDILEGKAAGCGWIIGVTTGAFSRSDLELLQPTHLIESLDELLPIFGVR
jgi:phosphonatase-like hydrolase